LGAKERPGEPDWCRARLIGVGSWVTLRGERAAVRQLALTWFAGSMVMGTVAALFLLFRPAQGGLGIEAVEPLGGLPWLARTVVVLLVLNLFGVLWAIAQDTTGASLLPPDSRGSAWWAIFTGVLGLLAWFFAASVTFGANFGPGWQVALAYLGGGLPFALVAGLLQRSGVVNLAAAGLSVWLVVAGFVLVAGHATSDPNALSFSFSCFSYLFGGSPGTGL
jgi:hypothetical protein